VKTPPRIPPTFEQQPVEIQVAPLEIHFNTAQVFVQGVDTPAGPARRLTLIHPNGVAAVALLPLEAAKRVGGQLLAPSVEVVPGNGIQT